MPSNKKCSICSKKCKRLLNSCGDGDNEDLLLMLNACVPEIEWNDRDALCNNCLDSLRTSYDFLGKATQSNRLRSIQSIKLPANDSSKWKYRCDLCEKQFLHKSHLRTHRNATHRDRSTFYYCNACDRTFRNKMFYNRHLVTYHDRSTEKPKTKRRYKDISCDKSQECTDLDGSVKKKRTLKSKKFVETNEIEEEDLAKRLFQNFAEQCDGYTKTIVKGFYLSKRNDANGKNGDKKTYSCAICGKTSILAQNVTKHSKLHASKRKFKRLILKPNATSLDDEDSGSSRCDILSSHNIQLVAFEKMNSLNKYHLNVLQEFMDDESEAKK